MLDEMLEHADDRLEHDLRRRLGDRAPRVVGVYPRYRQVDRQPYQLELACTLRTRRHGTTVVGVPVEDRNWEAAYRALVEACATA